MNKTGSELIADERKRQIEKEGYTAAHDDGYVNHELVLAADTYLQLGWVTEVIDGYPPFTWPWDDRYYKPSEDPIRNLVKAGALIAAEIDRLQRLETGKPEGGLNDR
jgi:hypothetical protein